MVTKNKGKKASNVLKRKRGKKFRYYDGEETSSKKQT
jgi:hypothetical protein